MKVTTESGAVYEVTKDRTKFRRVRKRLDIDPHSEVDRAKLACDGQWRALYSDITPVVGQSMMILVQDESGVLLHPTTVVVGIER